MKKTIITVVGFAFFLIGFTALFLSLVGIRFSMLAFLDSFGSTASLVSKIIMIMLGFILIYIGKSKELLID